MNRPTGSFVVLSLVLLLAPGAICGQEWTAPVRGSWVQTGPAGVEDVLLAADGQGCEIVVATGEHSAVRQAAKFLADDIGTISGYTPPIVAAASGTRVAIHLVTLTEQAHLPAAIDRDFLRNKWEAYEVATKRGAVWLVGSNFRGTAFAAYTLSERLGIDPLYHWTGHQPDKHPRLILRQTHFLAGPPTFKYRGFFHDDEDILPRPLDRNGYPDGTLGVVPQEWYERFFETALRLRMNQVAPYTRVRRRFEVQQTARDWGLFYSSHHYDILLSNPWGYKRHGLAQDRRIGGEWDWYNNREGMLRFWHAGVEENGKLDCIWPVGLRDNDDKNYSFPANTPMAEKRRVFGEVIAAQVEMTKALLPPGKEALFHLTMYNASLDIFQSGPIPMPPEVIQVWNDDGIGRMRALPTSDMAGRKHGVYYHLAYVAWPLGDTMQNQHVVSPPTIAAQFRDIVRSGATEYMLVNVSELREFVMEARMIGEICWDAPTALRGDDPAGRYLGWWSREYFDPAAVADATRAYRRYYELFPTSQSTWWDSDRVKDALARLQTQSVGQPAPLADATRAELAARATAFAAVLADATAAEAKMPAERRPFFYEHVQFPLLLGARQLQAAQLLHAAADASVPAERERLAFVALAELRQLNADTARSERPPFTAWYRNTWVRRKEHECDLQRSFRNVERYCAQAFEDSCFTRRAVLSAEPQSPLAGRAVFSAPLAGTAAAGETVKLTADFRVHQGAFRAEPLFCLGLSAQPDPGAALRLAARVALNNWEQGSLDAWAMPEPAGSGRAASSPLQTLGWDTAATPMDQDSAPLRLIFTATRLVEPGRWITRCSVLNRENGHVVHTMEETIDDAATYDAKQPALVFAMDGPQAGTSLTLERLRAEILTPRPDISGSIPDYPYTIPPTIHPPHR